MSGPATREDLEAFARFLARITLEIERGQRDPGQLRAFMPDQTWQHWQHSRPPGKFAGGPVHRTDIGRPRVELLTDHRAIANVVTTTDPGRWGALTMKLDAINGRWRAASIQRLYAARHYRAGALRPVVPIPIEQRLATAHTDRDQAADALVAVDRRRDELPHGSRGRRHANQLSTTWTQVIADLDREIATLHHQQQTGLEVRHARHRSRHL